MLLMLLQDSFNATNSSLFFNMININLVVDLS